MDRLPSELLQIIFGHLSNEDIINLPYSISCKGLTNSELSRRFAVYRGIWIDEQSLKVLVRASNHPLIGLITQELQFDLDRVPYVCKCEFKDWHWSNHLPSSKFCDDLVRRVHPMEWHTNSAHRRTLCSPEAAHTTSLPSSLNIDERCIGCVDSERKWARYQQLYQSQCHLAASEGDIDLMTLAFESLASVKTITIANQLKVWNSKTKELLGDAWCEGFDHDRAKGSGAHLMRVILKALAGSGLKLRQFRQLPVYLEGTSKGYQECAVFDLTGLSQVLSRTACQDIFCHLKIFKLGSIHYPLEDIQKYRRWRARDEDIFRRDLQGYQDCDVGNLSPRHRNGEDNDQSEGGCSDLTLTQHGTTRALAAILASCPLIEDLELGIVGGWKEEVPHIPLLKMLGQHNQLSSLRRLELANCRMEEGQLSGALLRCAPTLEILSLWGMFLDCGTWISLLDDLRGRFDRLTNFETGFEASLLRPCLVN